MPHLFQILIVGVVVLNLIVLFGRVIPGPTLFDRLAGVGVIGTNTLLLLLLLGVMVGRWELYVDMSIAYAATGFITLITIGKYFEAKGDVER